MTGPIRTKWHRIRELLTEDEVYLTAPSEEIAGVEHTSHHWDMFKHDKQVLLDALDVFDAFPKFVIDPELMELAAEREYNRSLLDLKRAGVLRLPFPQMIVELPSMQKDAPSLHAAGLNTAQHIVVLRDLQSNTVPSWEDLSSIDADPGVRESEFYGMVFTVCRDKSGEYLVLSAAVPFVSIIEEDDLPKLQISGCINSFFTATKEVRQHASSIYLKEGAAVFQALRAALLIMMTGGVEREVIECEPLNKKRRKSGKPVIPKHTYIRIGRVYRSASSTESDQYVPGRSPRPHWRRAHLWPQMPKEQWRKEWKPKVRPGRIVAYAGGEEPHAPTYVVKK